MTFTETQPGVWFDETQQYRIKVSSLIRETAGRVVYYSAVLCDQIGVPGRTYWSLCGAHRPYKSFAAALRAARKHRRLWVSAIRASRLREPEARAKSLERIKLRGRVGVDRTKNYLFGNLPAWVMARAPKAPERIISGYRKLCKHVSKDPIATSPSFVPSVPGPVVELSQEKRSTRASPVSVQPESTTPMPRHARSKVTRIETPSGVTHAEAPAQVHAKRARRPTTESSPSGKRRPRGTTASRRSAKKGSRN